MRVQHTNDPHAGPVCVSARGGRSSTENDTVATNEIRSGDKRPALGPGGALVGATRCAAQRYRGLYDSDRTQVDETHFIQRFPGRLNLKGAEFAGQSSHLGTVRGMASKVSAACGPPTPECPCVADADKCEGAGSRMLR